VLPVGCTNGHNGEYNDEASGTPQMSFDPTMQQVDFSQFNLYGTDRLSDAWFGQHIVNLDWMGLPILLE
jgi:hypothetical protein